MNEDDILHMLMCVRACSASVESLASHLSQLTVIEQHKLITSERIAEAL